MLVPEIASWLSLPVYAQGDSETELNNESSQNQLRQSWTVKAVKAN